MKNGGSFSDITVDSENLDLIIRVILIGFT